MLLLFMGYVVCFIPPPPPGGFAGFVVGIVEEGRRPYVVTIPPEESVGQGGSATVAAVPMDPRVPKIRIKTRQLAQVCVNIKK